MLRKNSKETWENLLDIRLGPIRLSPKGLKVKRESEEAIVAIMVRTTQPNLRRRASTFNRSFPMEQGTDKNRLGQTLPAVDKVQELQRKLYQRAKSEPNLRFYSLYDKIYREDVLQKAWKKVKANYGRPGIDGVTIEAVEEAGVDKFISQIQQELKTKTYRPTPVRRVNIPKPQGGTRPLGIPTIKDRLVGVAIKIVIEPIFEADFEPASYGYRPKRSTQQAAKEIRKYLNFGYTQVVDADITDCFGSIPHTELLNMVARRINDGRVLSLIKMFLKAGVMKEDQSYEDTTTGTPQGGVISPLLANIYLDTLDKGWKGQNKLQAILIRYADDMVILTKERANQCQRRLTRMLSGMKLRLNETKTKAVDVNNSTLDFVGFSFRKRLNRARTKKTIYYWPSHKAVMKIRQRIRQITNTKRPLRAEEIVTQLNPAIRGWVNNFRMANSSGQFNKLRRYTANKLRKFMRRRRNLAGYGYKEYPDTYLYGQLGLYRDYRVSWTKAI